MQVDNLLLVATPCWEKCTFFDLDRSLDRILLEDTIQRADVENHGKRLFWAVADFSTIHMSEPDISNRHMSKIIFVFEWGKYLCQ